ncbi:MAG: insulinase family protein [Hyphomicrobiales bacterium]|nr:insulinase family protein [Hyphomicrobiales bacterium]
MMNQTNQSIRVSALPNGMRVVTETMPGLQTAALGVWVEAGARAESAREHGMAHLLEHMAFKGTERRSAVDIAEEIEAVGGDLNAATSIETTAYYARVLKDDIPLAVDILADILQNAVFDALELEREQNVIVQEIRASEDTPDDIVFDLAQGAAFQGQTLGRTILGTEETVRGFRSGDLTDYLRRHYAPAQMILAAAGAVDHDAMVGLAGEFFAGLSESAHKSQAPACFTGGIGKVARPIEQSHLVISFEGLSHHHEDYYAAQVFATLLGGGMSSRLFQEAREKRGLCYGIYSYHWSVSDTGLFGVYAATAPETTPELMEVIAGVLKNAAADIGGSELKRAKAQLKAGLLMSLERPSSRIGQMGQQIAAHGRVQAADELIAAVERVTREDMIRLAESWHRAVPAIGLVGPESGLETTCRVAAELFGTAE